MQVALETRRQNQQAIGLLELMLALAIIAVLIIMATRYYQTTARSARINEAVAHVNAIIGAASQYQLNNGSYLGLTGQKLVDLGLLSPSILKTPWGGNTLIQNYGRSTVFIRFQGLPRNHTDCVTFYNRLRSDNSINWGGGADCTIDYETVAAVP